MEHAVAQASRFAKGSQNDRLSGARQPKGMRLRSCVLGLAPLFLAGCLTHLPPKAEMCHLGIHWAPDYTSALARAQESGKPILACLVAGKIDGLC
jgi:hypothetical protein